MCLNHDNALAIAPVPEITSTEHSIERLRHQDGAVSYYQLQDGETYLLATIIGHVIMYSKEYSKEENS